MIKYLGSKRTLVPVLGAIAQASGAKTSVDLFTGTTRVAQEFKRRGIHVIANDVATYSEVLGQCYISTDARHVDVDYLDGVLDALNALPGKPGYFTQTFCVESRFFQPHNGARIDAIRDAIEQDFSDSWLRPLLLTSLLEAADRVDSTTGLHMAYLKQWAPRSFNDLELKRPTLIEGDGATHRSDAKTLAARLPRVDLMYLDPPYNQHRYFTNYHVWETLIRWDQPESYGVARKRIDARDEQTKSVYNMKRRMPGEMAELLATINTNLAVVSYNNESWIDADTMIAMLRDAGFDDVAMLAFDFKRYVGAQIGIHNQAGVKVGKVSHLKNQEYLFIAGPSDLVSRCVEAATRVGACRNGHGRAGTG